MCFFFFESTSRMLFGHAVGVVSSSERKTGSGFKIRVMRLIEERPSEVKGNVNVQTATQNGEVSLLVFDQAFCLIRCKVSLCVIFNMFILLSQTNHLKVIVLSQLPLPSFAVVLGLVS